MRYSRRVQTFPKSRTHTHTPQCAPTQLRTHTQNNNSPSTIRFTHTPHARRTHTISCIVKAEAKHTANRGIPTNASDKGPQTRAKTNVPRADKAATPHNGETRPALKGLAPRTTQQKRHEAHTPRKTPHICSFQATTTRRKKGNFRVRTLIQTYFQARPESAICVQNFDDSLNPAIRITYRSSQRSSSMCEPRHPLLKVAI